MEVLLDLAAVEVLQSLSDLVRLQFCQRRQQRPHELALGRARVELLTDADEANLSSVQGLVDPEQLRSGSPEAVKSRDHDAVDAVQRPQHPLERRAVHVPARTPGVFVDLHEVPTFVLREPFDLLRLLG
ncbi:MAG: hypothetical protein Q7T67_14915 [Patulibacter sp.]|nr:hypothetical protein [Patulibacter sp.]MDO9409703.1 hypothetical protein [Patulibacter sp.]